MSRSPANCGQLPSETSGRTSVEPPRLTAEFVLLLLLCVGLKVLIGDNG